MAATQALKLFRSVLLASGSIPGAFPPVLIDVEGNGKRFAEMHVDGGVGGQFFVAPPALMASNSSYQIPATRFTSWSIAGLQPDFQIRRPHDAGDSRAVGRMAVKADMRLMLDRAYVAAKHSGIGFNVATIPPSFNAPSRGAFDPDYMKALFKVGYDHGKSANPFAGEPPPYPGPPASVTSDPQTWSEQMSKLAMQVLAVRDGNRNRWHWLRLRRNAVASGAKRAAHSRAYDGCGACRSLPSYGPCDRPIVIRRGSSAAACCRPIMISAIRFPAP